MRCNADRLIEGLITAQVVEVHSLENKKHKEHVRYKEQKGQKTWEKTDSLVVTVSRTLGSRGRSTGQLLADTLELRCCDRLILQEVARRANVEEELVQALDEHVSHFHDHWWQRLFNKDVLTYEEYYKNLVKTVLSVSRCGGVIIGRGSNFILGPERAFRVRIIGSPEKRAIQVAHREGIDIEVARQRVDDVDKERAEYIRMLYDADIDDPSSYDLVLNSDRYNRIQMVSLILDAMETAGYKLPADARQSIQLMSDE